MKKLIAVLLFGLPLFAQVQVAPFVNPKVQFFNAGVPCSGCKLNTYAAGTSSQQPTYSDSLGTTPNSNPVVMDGNGFATIYLTSQNYKFVLTTSAGGVIWSQDNVSWNNLASTLSALTVAGAGPVTINSATAATSGANQTGPQFQECGNFWNGSASGSDCWSWQDVLGTGTNPTSTLTLTHSGSSGAASVSIPSVTVALGGNETVAGTLAVTGNVIETAGQNQYKAFLMNGVRWVDGIKYTTLAGCYADLSAGQTCKVPPGYTETLTANLVLNKKQTSIQFEGGATITLGAFNVQVAQGTDDVSIISPFAHSSDQGGNCVGVCFNGYTGAGAAIDVGSSAGFTYNTLIRGIQANLSSAQANAIGYRLTNGVQSALDDDSCTQGAVSGQKCFTTVGTGALFAGLIRILSPECSAAFGATNNICIQLGTISNDITIIGGHANILGSGANNSVCIDVSGSTSGNNQLYGFDCDTGVTAVTVESTVSRGIYAVINVDSGVTNGANFAANSLGNTVIINANLPYTDNGISGTNTYNNPSRNNWRTDVWQNAVGGTFAFFFKDLLDSGNDRLTLVNGAAGDTRINAGSGAGLIKMGWEQGTGGTDFGNGAGATSGAFITSGGIIQGKNTVRVASDFTTANNTSLQTITGLSWTFPAVARNYSFHCALLYSQATAAVADQFGIQVATNAPTNVAAVAEAFSSATAQTVGTIASLTTTTATPIVTFTPSAITTIFGAQIDGTFELPASANTVNIMVQTSNGTDVVTVKRGSYCQLF